MGEVIHTPRHCERSEAIHSFFLLLHGLLRRFAPRNDVATPDMTPHSRGAVRPRFAKNIRPENRGRGECRAPDAPAASCAHIGNKYAHEYSQRAIGKHPTFPHAMVYGLYRALPGDRLSCHRHQRLPANLTPASGCQDHTSSPSAASNARQARRRVHRIPPRVRDVASRPSEWDETARDIQLIWVF